MILRRVMVACRAACGESFPMPNTYETVVFDDFLKCGLSFPLSFFFVQVLEFYGVELVNLNPNSILFLSVFTHLCEAYLGIRPMLNLFCYFYSPKKWKANQVRGCVGFSLRDGKK